MLPFNTTGRSLAMMEENCPAGITMEELGCGWYLFSIEGADATSSATWNINGNEIMNTGQPFSFQFEDGVVSISVIFSGSECPEYTDSINLDINCAGICPTTFDIQPGLNCGQFSMSFDALDPAQSIQWNTTFNGVPWQESTEGFTPYVGTFPGPEVYEICATYLSPGCPAGVVICQELPAPGCNTNECGFIIQTTQYACNGLTFFIPGILSTTEVTWDMGDGNQITTQGGGPFSYSYANESCYGVYATFEADNCEGPVSLFHFAMAICEVFQCQPVIISAPIPDQPVLWWIETIDGQQFQQGICNQANCSQEVCLHTGCYILRITPGTSGEAFLMAESPMAAVALTYLETVNFTDSYLLSINAECGASCETNINYNAGPDNSYFFYAETGSLIPAQWDLPDGSSVFSPSVNLSLPDPGTYQMCAHFDDAECGPITQCLTLTVFEGGCTDAGFLLSTDENIGGMAVWSLIHEDGLVDNTGQINLDDNLGYFGHSECLPAGCYLLDVTVPAENPDAMGILIIGPWLIIADTVMWNGETFHYQATLGMQSDCSQMPDCTLEVETYSVDGFQYQFATGDQSNLTPVAWTINGELMTTDSALFAVFGQTGTYEVCASSFHPFCGTVTDCVEVTVAPESCTLATISLVLDTPAVEEQTWQVENTQWLEMPQTNTLTIPAGTNSASWTLCLIDGCYDFTAFPLSGDDSFSSVSVEVALNGVMIEFFNPGGWWEGVYYQDYPVNANCYGFAGGLERDTPPIFPNPTNGPVQLSGWPAGTEVMVMDGCGQIVKSIRTQVPSETLMMNDLPSGCYALSLTNGQLRFFYRIAVLH